MQMEIRERHNGDDNDNDDVRHCHTASPHLINSLLTPDFKYLTSQFDYQTSTLGAKVNKYISCNQACMYVLEDFFLKSLCCSTGAFSASVK